MIPYGMLHLHLIIPILGIFAIPYLYGGFGGGFKGRLVKLDRYSPNFCSYINSLML